MSDFAGVTVEPGESTDVVKAVDNTPAPPKPEAPKPPVGWDKTSYSHARQARKEQN